MKKLLLSLTVISATVSINAQIINGDLENWSNGDPVNWEYDFGAGNGGVQSGTYNAFTQYGEAPSTTQTPGMTSGTGALLETIEATSTDLMNAGYTNFPGRILGEWSYSGPSLESISFDFDARPVAGDTCWVAVYLYNFAGDVTKEVSKFWLPSDATSGWTSTTIPFVQQGNFGSVTKIEIVCVSSYATTGGAWETGSTLKVDNFVLNEESSNSIDESSTIELSAFPNPANDVLNIKTNSQGSSVSVISIEGKEVLTQEMNGSSAAVNVTELKSGVYFYEVTTANGSASRSKFVKQ